MGSQTISSEKGSPHPSWRHLDRYPQVKTDAAPGKMASQGELSDFASGSSDVVTECTQWTSKIFTHHGGIELPQIFFVILVEALGKGQGKHRIGWLLPSGPKEEFDSTFQQKGIEFRVFRYIREQGDLEAINTLIWKRTKAKCTVSRRSLIRGSSPTPSG